MKNLSSVLIVMCLLILGCGYELVKKEDSPPLRAEDSRDKPGQTEDSNETRLEKEKRELKKKIDSLEKQVDTEKVRVPKRAPVKTELEMGEMRVKSPGDGWLALRSRANSGSRLIMKIPHGAIIQVDYCGPLVRSGRLRGRWCQVEYRNRTGWAFDYYMTR